MRGLLRLCIPVANEGTAMRLMLGIWTAIVCGGLAYFIVIGLTHN